MANTPENEAPEEHPEPTENKEEQDMSKERVKVKNLTAQKQVVTVLGKSNYTFNAYQEKTLDMTEKEAQAAFAVQIIKDILKITK